MIDEEMNIYITEIVKLINEGANKYGNITFTRELAKRMYKEVDSDYIINLVDEIFTFAKLQKSDGMFDVLIEAIDVETICRCEFDMIDFDDLCGECEIYYDCEP